MKKTILLIFAALLFTLNTNAFAIMYEWRDKNGNLHITDSMEKIPDDYRAEAIIRKADPPKGTVVDKPDAQPMIPGGPTGPAPTSNPVDNSSVENNGNELYGDMPLSWWKDALERKRAEIQRAEARISSKEQYNRIYENGMRNGQIFELKDTARYNKNVAEIKEDNNKLSELKAELEEILRKATNAGVPRKVRGEE